jgi:hypothetical protein
MANPIVLAGEKARMEYISTLKKAGYNTGSEWGTGNYVYKDPRTGQQVKGYEEPGTKADPRAGEAQMAEARRVMDAGNMTGGRLSFGGVTQAYINNGNPMYVGGTAKMNIGGDIIDVPNALAQSLQFQQAWNEGRWQMGEILGRSTPAGQYASNDVLKQQFERLKQTNPELYDPTRGVTKSADYTMKKDALTSQINELQNKPKVYRETATVAGITNDGGQAADKAKMASLLDQTRRLEMEKGYQDRRSDWNSEGKVNSLRKMVEGYTPTTSNLKIKETWVGDNKKYGFS